MLRASVAALLLALGLVASFSPTLAAPAFDRLRPWTADVSFAGGREADPRLDQPVRFWRAALTLEEVFAGITQQTGVRVGFFPEGDQNRRMRVHLFLNQEQPPALRDLLVQLVWVVDCPFFVSDEGGPRAYYLMSTSLASGADKGLQQQKEATHSANEQRWEAIRAELKEYREAFPLDRAALVRKYRGRDDYLLLNLLDPARRAAVSFALRHEDYLGRPPRVYGARQVLGSVGMGLSADQLSEDDRADVKAAFGIPDTLLTADGPPFALDVEMEGRLSVGPDRGYLQRPGLTLPKGPHWEPYCLVDVSDDFVLEPLDELALRRLAGESAPRDEDEQAVVLGHLMDEIDARRQQKREARLAAERGLSLRMTERLRALRLHMQDVDRLSLPIPAWTAEEAVAKASGLNVVSDGLLWARRYPWPAYSSNVDDKTMAALEVLDSFTHEPAHETLAKPSWEWGDAGSFLRFRTRDRAIWRGAMLPEDFLSWVDDLLAPRLPPSAGVRPAGPESVVEVPLELAPAVRALGQLSEVQMGFGDYVSYGDPMDPLAVARRSALGRLFDGTMHSEQLVRFLASLDGSQWQLLRGEGLRCDRDLKPDQQAWLLRKPGSTNFNFALRPEQAAGCTIQLTDKGPQGMAPGHAETYAKRNHLLVFHLAAQQGGEGKMPAHDVVRDVLPRTVGARVGAR